jgi:hypothetical protein
MVDEHITTPPEPEKVPPPHRRKKGNSGESPGPETTQAPEPETTFDRAKSLPDEALAAPGMTPSQEAPDLDDEFASAVAPEDDDVDLNEDVLGPPRYTVVERRTTPPKMVPFRIFPKEEGVTKTVYMLAVDRGAQDEGELDTYLLSEKVRVHLASHPVFQKQIRRYQIRLGMTSLGKPFFLEINLDDHGVWGTSRRNVAERAEMEWTLARSQGREGYVSWPADHYDDLSMPEQGYLELYNLSYKPCFISGLNHPVILRGAFKKAKNSGGPG